MAVLEIKQVNCDVCKSIIDAKQHKACALSVIFTTEQTEGRSITPYLSQQNIDICKGCMDTILSGKMLFAHGAMGYNIYYFRN